MKNGASAAICVNTTVRLANSGATDMAKALKGKEIYPRIRVEDNGSITYAVSCRHCTDAICVKSCISGALSKKDGTVCIDKSSVSAATPAF